MNRTIYIFLLLTCQLFSQNNQNFKYDFSLENEKSVYKIKAEEKSNEENVDVKIVLKDSKNESLESSQITIFDLNNNQSFSTLSDINGIAELNLTPGKYSIKIERVGFTKIEISEINITIHDSLIINAILGYAWENNLEGSGTIKTKTKLSKKNLEKIIKELNRDSNIKEVNGIKFTVSWQI